MSTPLMARRKPSLALGLSGSGQSQTLPRSRPPSPSWIVSEPSTESIARVAGCVQTAFSELNLPDDQDSTTISKLQRSLSSAAPSDQREAAITGAYMLAKRGEWQRLEPIADDLNTLTNACGLTVLMVAVSKGDKATAKGLVERGISAFSKTAQGTSALHVAAKKGDAEMMRVVQDTAGNVDKTDILTRTPLHIAVYYNNVEAVQYLVQDLAAKLDSPAPYAPGLWDEEPTTTEASLEVSPITLAVLLGHTECFDMIMQRVDARTEVASSDIGNLCHVAVHFRQTAMLEHLLKNYSELAQRYLKGEDAKGLTPAGVAAATGDIDSLEVIYRYAPKTILAKDRCGRTPVHWAAEGLHTEVLEFYGKHIPPQIACFEKLSTPIGGLKAKSPIAILQDLLEKSPRDLRTQQAASAAQRIMRQHKLGELQSAEVLSKSSDMFLPRQEPRRNEQASAAKAFPLPPKIKYEVERTELLGQIEEAFTDNHLVVLHGITGTGKTHLASAFGRKQAGKEVYWINASTEGLVPAYVRLAKKLRLITEEELKTPGGQQQAVARVTEYFSERSNCVLILDDVTSENDLSFEEISLIPERGAQVLLTRVLITSQSDLFSEGQLVQVEKLTVQEALELFTKTIKKPAPEELLSELSERLFYHPLLINMTGCYIRQMSLQQRTKPLDTIITEEINRLKESLTHLPQGHEDQILTKVEERWAINLARAKKVNKHVEKTLGICAYFAPTGIPVGWFEGEMKESFGILEVFGFCQFEDEACQTVAMHSLVMLMSRKKTETNEFTYLREAAQTIIRQLENGDPLAADKYSAYQAANPLIDSVKKADPTHEHTTHDVANLGSMVVRYSNLCFSFTKSRDILEWLIPLHIEKQDWGCLYNLFKAYRHATRGPLGISTKKTEEYAAKYFKDLGKEHGPILEKIKFICEQKALEEASRSSAKAGSQQLCYAYVEDFIEQDHLDAVVSAMMAPYRERSSGELSPFARLIGNQKRWAEALGADGSKKEEREKYCEIAFKILIMFFWHAAEGGENSQINAYQSDLKREFAGIIIKNPEFIEVASLISGSETNIDLILGKLSNLTKSNPFIKLIYPIILGTFGYIKARNRDGEELRGLDMLKSAVEEMENNPSKGEPDHFLPFFKVWVEWVEFQHKKSVDEKWEVVGKLELAVAQLSRNNLIHPMYPVAVSILGWTYILLEKHDKSKLIIQKEISRLEKSSDQTFLPLIRSTLNGTDLTP